MPSSKAKNKPKPTRGEPIRFTKGTYAGQTGWVNTALPETTSSVYVIINEKQGVDQDHGMGACVRKTSVAPIGGDPKSIEEFVVKEDPNVAYHLAKLAQALAECGVASSPELLEIVKKHIDIACIVQLNKGKKAKYSETALRVSGIRSEKSKKDHAMPDVARSASGTKK